MINRLLQERVEKSLIKILQIGQKCSHIACKEPINNFRLIALRLLASALRHSCTSALKCIVMAHDFFASPKSQKSRCDTASSLLKKQKSRCDKTCLII